LAVVPGDEQRGLARQFADPQRLVDDLKVVAGPALVPVAVQQHLDRDVGLSGQQGRLGRLGTVQAPQFPAGGPGLRPPLRPAALHEAVEILKDEDRHEEPDRPAGHGGTQGVPRRPERLALHEHRGVQHYRVAGTTDHFLLCPQLIFYLLKPLLPLRVLPLEHAAELMLAYRPREDEPVIVGLQFDEQFFARIEQ
jgi:hypothetical protein